MSLSEIHAGLAQSATLFMIALGVWAIFLRIRSRPLDGSWYGGLAVGEILLVAQFAIANASALSGERPSRARISSFGSTTVFGSSASFCTARGWVTICPEPLCIFSTAR